MGHLRRPPFSPQTKSGSLCVCVCVVHTTESSLWADDGLSTLQMTCIICGRRKLDGVRLQRNWTHSNSVAFYKGSAPLPTYVGFRWWIDICVYLTCCTDCNFQLLTAAVKVSQLSVSHFGVRSPYIERHMSKDTSQKGLMVTKMWAKECNKYMAPVYPM